MARALLIHPWIHDFAAHDFWLKPLGLLRIAEYLRGEGVDIEFIDCLDPQHPSVARAGVGRGPFGQGKFFKSEIPKPPVLEWFPRRYSRYGMPPFAFEAELRKAPRPDVMLVTSGMTYWYPGVQETIAQCKKVFPDSPVVLGGVYAALCPEHAREYSGADCVVTKGDWPAIRQSLRSFLSLSEGDQQREIIPAWDLMPKTEGVVVRSSVGCPWRCPYCASRVLAPAFCRRNPEAVALEISEALRQTVARDVAFYDDALLWEGEAHLLLIMKALDRLKVFPRFHCPNGLHARSINAALARLMHRYRFTTIRLGLESADPIFHERMGRKLRLDEFDQAVHALHGAGYAPAQIGVYVMAGLPEQSMEEVEVSIQYVLEVGARPYIAEYSPIPGTALWKQAIQRSPFPLEDEPLFHNNTLVPCRWPGFSYEDLLKLKSSLPRLSSQRSGP